VMLIESLSTAVIVMISPSTCTSWPSFQMSHFFGLLPWLSPLCCQSATLRRPLLALMLAVRVLPASVMNQLAGQFFSSGLCLRVSEWRGLRRRVWGGAVAAALAGPGGAPDFPGGAVAQRRRRHHSVGASPPAHDVHPHPRLFCASGRPPPASSRSLMNIAQN